MGNGGGGTAGDRAALSIIGSTASKHVHRHLAFHVVPNLLRERPSGAVAREDNWKLQPLRA